MTQLVLFLSGIMSLVALIVFFVMAVNVSSIVRLLRTQNELLKMIQKQNDTPDVTEKARRYDAAEKQRGQ